MTEARAHRRWWVAAWLWLVVVIAVGAHQLHFWSQSRLDADVLALLPAQAQDPRFATRAPMIRRPVVVAEDAPAAMTALVVTVNGPDRPGIVSQIAGRALGFGSGAALCAGC